MPGRIAPAYVAVDANSLITPVTAGWFGGPVLLMNPCVLPCPDGAPIVCHGAVFSPLCARRARM